MSDQSAITLAESKRLVELEEVIERGIGTFKEVGEALAEIRDQRLYKSGYKTFEDYCREEWQMSKRHCDRLISSAEIAANLGPTGPKTESQARPLAKLSAAEDKQEAWQAAVESAPDGKPTAKHVEAAVEKVKARTEPPAERIQFRPSNGLQYAAMAINNLEKIAPNDEQLTAALDKVQRYLETRRK